MTTPAFLPGALPTYMSGSLITSTATFLDDNGNPADPNTITLKYQAGSGSVITVAYPSLPVVRVSTGVYQAELDSTGWTGYSPQFWTVEWIGTGNVQAIGVGYWNIVRAPL